MEQIDPTERVEQIDPTERMESDLRGTLADVHSEVLTLGDVLDHRPLPPPRVVRRGTRFGDYSVLAKLGQGGMGVVYLAEHGTSHQRVALKTIRPGFVAEGESLERFLREGTITASLRHPGIVGIHELALHEGEPYLVYELVEGARNLDKALLELDLRGQVELIRDVSRALGHAHAQGVVHRDVKPGNVLIDEAGRPRLADFGLAAATSLERITRSAAVLGTPRYMAPELAAGRQVDPTVDVWALGIILYETLAGSPPFEAASWIEYLAQAQGGVLELPTHPEREIPPALGEVCLRALRGDPRVRTPNAGEFADQLERFLSGELSPTRPALSPRVRTLGLGAAALVALALGAFVVQKSSTPAPPARLAWVGSEGVATVFNSEEFALEGRVDSSQDWVELEVTGLKAPLRVRPGPFLIAVPLRVGSNLIEVRVLDPGGETSGAAPPPLTRRVQRWTVPRWFLELPPARRAPLPLPSELEFAEAGYRNRADDSILVWIPPTTTRLGSNRPQAAMFLHEGPEHEVRLDGYFLGKTEVTWRQVWRYCEAKEIEQSQPSFPVSPDHPAHSVTWPEARAYCSWAGLRLPTEAEWEHAARGPKGLLVPWGGKTLDSVRANLLVSTPLNDRFPKTSPVGSFPTGASPFGCLDMVGNVYEWVFDLLDEYPVGPLVNPRGPSAGDFRVLRGGAHTSTDVQVCQTTFRWSAEPSRRNPKIGFRVAFSPERKAPPR